MSAHQCTILPALTYLEAASDNSVYVAGFLARLVVACGFIVHDEGEVVRHSLHLNTSTTWRELRGQGRIEERLLILL